MEVSPVVEALIGEFEQDKPKAREEARLTVSKTVSALAVLYEKARNAVEFRAEHLIRRAAIERILKRRIILNGGSTTIAENLMVELLWARYIDSSLVSDKTIAHIQKIIERYLSLRRTVFGGTAKIQSISWDTVLGVASAEIEETIVSPKKREALVNFLYQAVRPKITIPAKPAEFSNMQTYIAVERSYAQSDDALILYHLIRITQPSWQELQTPPEADAHSFLGTLSLSQAALRDPIAESVTRYVRRQVPPFLILRDVFLEQSNIRALIENQALFEQKLAQTATRRYLEIGAKVRRAVVRSIIYIFLTKMIFALALEAPVDIFITKRIAYIPLAINTLFPPVLMFLVAGFFSIPGPENTKLLIDRAKKILYDFDGYIADNDPYVPKAIVRRPILTAVFSLFYLGTFLLTFGVISYVLTQLHFNLASQTIFVFFVTLVSFFAYRIRQSAKEYEVESRQGVLEPMVDFFFLPVLRAGHILSQEIAKLNVFIFLFDFILEAPLKVIFEVTEEWIRFIRLKKEEII
ncbi:hypothetical protein A2875_02600 [Candidatus Gottesmanbacteria bacterium RIFCSPHIGHO2_01_FULL_46_14]|uniref:Uncharacterized protein n=2 Tax=Patescibacteria group TaxID=1783273 RepID=A0A1F5ZP58_9BACT|nr:MAG: hypothetical protein UW78_C0020G0004 [Candidatus Azambacteria bacterium GW2011_GWA1_44_9]OGG14163.1 MAG: hypothetical protein A2875_02600 [Candidatus Gottesmanbacteria bacterium RIFCSPHIGHO2_01_FULL_46_14]HCR81429.1 hypothetical protein [Candidatus Paceibacterota bacterium]